MGITFPGESPAYRAARDHLLGQEIELRRAMEPVAAARRRLPPGGVVSEDYIFHGEGPSEVTLSELFAPGRDSLVIYSFMFPRDAGDERPGPESGETSLLRLELSSAGNTYNRDYLAETPDGAQRPMLNVFHRDGDHIRHFWGSELFYAPTEPGQDPPRQDRGNSMGPGPARQSLTPRGATSRASGEPTGMCRARTTVRGDGGPAAPMLAVCRAPGCRSRRRGVGPRRVCCR